MRKLLKSSKKICYSGFDIHKNSLACLKVSVEESGCAVTKYLHIHKDYVLDIHTEENVSENLASACFYILPVAKIGVILFMTWK